MASRRRSGWTRGASRYESEYLRRMRAITNAIRRRLEMVAADDYNALVNVAAEFERMGDNIAPYANRIARQMLERVNLSSARDLQKAAKDVVGQAQYRYIKNSVDISRSLDRLLQDPTDPVAVRYRQLLEEQVNLITSLPRQAARDVQQYATDILSSGERVTQQKIEEYAERIKKKAADEGDLSFFIGNKAENRARMIARTEVSRASTLLTQSRAEQVGSKGYIWRTSRDVIVRDSHRDMEGEYVDWDDPPTLDGLTGHAGALPNCRCTAQVIL